jgi:hypothetical protein
MNFRFLEINLVHGANPLHQKFRFINLTINYTEKIPYNHPILGYLTFINFGEIKLMFY